MPSDGRPLAPADEVAFGVCRLLTELGYGVLTEFRLPSGQRVDVIGVDDSGGFAVVEVKTSVADLRGDRKWQAYRAYCDQFYFAVPEGFPVEAVPAECGLIVADRFGGSILRPAPVEPMNAARRRRQTVRFALAAGSRLQRLRDPGS